MPFFIAPSQAKNSLFILTLVSIASIHVQPALASLSTASIPTSSPTAPPSNAVGSTITLPLHTSDTLLHTPAFAAAHRTHAAAPLHERVIALLSLCATAGVTCSPIAAMAGLLALQGAAPITITALALGRTSISAAHLLAESGPAGFAAGTGRLLAAEAALWAARHGLATAAADFAAAGAGAGAAEVLVFGGFAGAMRAWSRPLDALGLRYSPPAAPALALAASAAAAAAGDEGAGGGAGRPRRVLPRRRWG